MDRFETKAVRCAEQGSDIESAPQVVGKNGVWKRLLDRFASVAGFVFQINVTFETQPRFGAEALVEFDQFGLVFPAKTFFGRKP